MYEAGPSPLASSTHNFGFMANSYFDAQGFDSESLETIFNVYNFGSSTDREGFVKTLQEGEMSFVEAQHIHDLLDLGLLDLPAIPGISGGSSSERPVRGRA